MVNYIIYNSNPIRKMYKFAKLEDPDILEKDLLCIFNRYLSSMGRECVKSIYDPRLDYIQSEYISAQNINRAGFRPFSYVYQDMIASIKEQNIKNNFVHTLESIFVDNDSSYKVYGAKDEGRVNIAHQIVHDFIVETKLVTYRYMLKRGSRIFILNIPLPDGLLSYILTTGFPIEENIDFFCTGTYRSNRYALGHDRHSNLKYVTTCILGKNRPSLTGGMDLYVNVEMGRNRKLDNINGCMEYVSTMNLEYPKYYDYQINWDIINRANSTIIGIMPCNIEYFSNSYNLPDEKLGPKFFKSISKLSESKKNMERG